MKQYFAEAFNDWGSVYTNVKVNATSYHTAANRAAYLAEKRSRVRGMKKMTIRLRLIGTIKKATPQEEE